MDSPLEKARGLMARKDIIELELETQLSILKAEKVTMQTPLLDSEGFPRADIDVWAVRTARVKIIELRNDLRDVMDAIGKALEGVYDPSLTAAAVADSSNEKAQDISTPKPFSKVESVAPGSPASEAVGRLHSLTCTCDHPFVISRVCRKTISWSNSVTWMRPHSKTACSNQ
jgi:26S proteasome non-ATPase regulatory subunit 9